ncbi:MAG TPA: hypothetical protein VJU61_20410 [Polyangiaceae bacterium]|nr:hypothetical protein [Polyangiaceae bacterium]
MAGRALSKCLPAATLALLLHCQAHVPERSEPALGAAAPPLSVSPGANLIGNGDFSHSAVPWAATALRADRSTRRLEVQLRDGALCVSLPRQTGLILGWPVAGSPDHFPIAAGRRYQLSVRASTGSAGLDCVAKVGHQLPPYTAVLAAPMHLTPSFQAFQFPFTAQRDDERAGVAVECLARGPSDTEVCIDDVAFVAL